MRQESTSKEGKRPFKLGKYEVIAHIATGGMGAVYKALDTDLKRTVALKILSPEMAHKLDLKEHVRAVMGQVEKDLGTKLEWVAIDHYNTDNPHAHIVMRGVDQEGKELRINKEYFTQGFRQRSIQEATRVLGLRLEQDAVLQRDKVIRAMHITEIDREIMRKLTKDNFINLTHPQSDFIEDSVRKNSRVWDMALFSTLTSRCRERLQACRRP